MQLEFHQLLLRHKGLRVVESGRLSRLTASIAREGQQEPVLVIAHGEAEFLLIDGYQRVTALRGLGRDTVEAVLMELSEVEALLLTWRLEAARRRSPLEDAWLLRELIETHSLTQSDLASRMQRTRSWVSERLALIRVLPEVAQEALQRGQLPGHGVSKTLVPWARRSKDHCEKLVRALEGAALTERQLIRLYDGWRGGDEEQRVRIVENPLLWLKAEDAVSPTEKPLSSPLLEMAAEFDSISGLCRKVRKRLRTGVFPRGNSSERRTANRSWKECCLAFDGLRERMGMEALDA